MDDAALQRIQDALNDNGYQKYCAWPDDGSYEVGSSVQDYCAVLASAEDEKPLQGFLAAQPWMLAAEDGSQCRWVIPQMSLSGKFFPDFLMGRLDSTGLNWTLVELQSPRARLFTKKDRPADQLREGIEQVQRWRRWLKNNRDMAVRSRAQDGLGLVSIGRDTRTDWSS